MDGFGVQMYLHDTSDFIQPTFTGRSNELATLAQWLPFEAFSTVHMVELAGLAGIGKTQLVYRYFVQHSYAYRALLWLDASSEEAFLADVRALLEKLGLLQTASDSYCVDELYIWMQRQEFWPWLLVLDGYQGGSLLIERLLAVRASGHVIITTRQQAVAGLQNILRLQSLSLDESITFLLRRAHLLALDADLESVSPDLITQGGAVVKAVDGLPLALDQIGAYVTDKKESLATCLDLLQKEPLTLFSQRGTLTTGESHPEPLAATYAQLFDELGHLHPLSLELLRVLAFLPAGNIPVALLQERAPAVDGPLAALLEDIIHLDQAIADIRKNLLMDLQILPIRALSLHPVVCKLLQVLLSPEQQHTFADQAERLNR